MQLAKMQQALGSYDVKAAGILSADEERARLYFRLRPTSLPLAIDPERNVHRAFGVPYMRIVAPEAKAAAAWPHSATAHEFGQVMVDADGELETAMPVPAAREELNRRDGFDLTDDDRRQRAQGHQLLGLFLIDRDGLVRWNWVEAIESRKTMGGFPSESRILSAVRALGAGA